MSDDDLVVRFEDAAERESGTHFLDYLDDPADKDLQNEIVNEVWDVMRQLKTRGLLPRLLPLLAATISPSGARRRPPACASPRRRPRRRSRASPATATIPTTSTPAKRSRGGGRKG